MCTLSSFRTSAPTVTCDVPSDFELPDKQDLGRDEKEISDMLSFSPRFWTKFDHFRHILKFCHTLTLRQGYL